MGVETCAIEDVAEWTAYFDVLFNGTSYVNGDEAADRILSYINCGPGQHPPEAWRGTEAVAARQQLAAALNAPFRRGK